MEALTSIAGKILIIFVLTVALVLCACDKSSPAAGDSAAAPSGAQAAEGTGIIRGRVLLGGNPPPPRALPASMGKIDESIVANSTGGLKNVIVYIANAPRATFAQTAPVVLDQINTVYVPHVLAVQAGQPLILKSSDNLSHNVHLQCQVNRDANFGFKAPGQQEIRLKLAEPPFKVGCDVHPWMTAWIGVFDHPWFAVTADDGSFTITRVPPGNYRLIAWQEVLPQQERTIVVSNDSTDPVSIIFPAP